MWDTRKWWVKPVRLIDRGYYLSCALSANGSVVVAGDRSGSVMAWTGNVGSWVNQATWQHGHGYGGIHSCAVSANGRVIVSASYNRTLKVWDINSEVSRMTLNGHTDEVMGCAISADGRVIVSASWDRTVKVWDAGSGTCLATLPVEGLLYNCACSTDASHIIAVGERGVYFLRFVR